MIPTPSPSTTPEVRERVGQRVRAPVDLGERERAELVDDHRLVRVAVGERRSRRPPGCAPSACSVCTHSQQAVGPHRADHARVHQHLHAAELVRRLDRGMLMPSLTSSRPPSISLLEILKGLLEIARHHRFGDLLRDRSEHPAGGVVGKPQRHARAESSVSRRRQRRRWSMPVTLVQARSAGSSNSTISTRPPTSAEPTWRWIE